MGGAILTAGLVSCMFVGVASSPICGGGIWVGGACIMGGGG